MRAANPVNCRPMRNVVLVLLGLWLAALAGPAAAARPPVVVELFTSQGCSSCTKSGDLIGELAARSHVLALTFAVDYWDYLGWTDTFAKPEFSARQRAYLKPLALGDVYTPQVIVNGRLQAAAVHPEAVDELVKTAAGLSSNPPQIKFAKDRVAVGSGRVAETGADVWLVRYDPREQSVQIKAGENRGQTVVERNVVRELVRLGAWRGRPKSYRLSDPSSDGLETVVIVQGVHGGRILAAGRD